MAETLLPTLVMAQEQTEWCWAAVAAAMVEDTDGRRLAQCEIVAKTNPDACAAPGQNNVQGKLDEVLLTLGLRPSVIGRGSLNIVDVDQSIAGASRPVGARIEDRTTRQGHMVLIVGCDRAAQTVVAADPWGTPGTAAPRYRMSFAELLNSYGEGGWGRCTHLFELV